jgi:hypothetical protein
MQLSGQHQPQGGGLVLCCFSWPSTAKKKLVLVIVLVLVLEDILGCVPA